MITTGVSGQPWRASITPWGSIEPWDGAPLGWYVAAEDRWHNPAAEGAVRQQRIEGTAVTETRVRVPNGDVVQRVYSVADAGGLTIVEVENESTAAVAIAFDRRDVLTERPIADVPIDGIDLPDDSFVVPLAHRATTRIAVPHDPGRTPAPGPIPAGVARALQVVRGWIALADRASRLALPDGALGSLAVEAMRAQRCELALGAVPRADDDPTGFAIALDQLVRMGERPDHWLPELVEAVERIGRGSDAESWIDDVALDAALRVVHAAGERRAVADLARIVAARSRSELPTRPPAGELVAPWMESRLANVDGALLPAGFPADWKGQSFEVYGLPTRPDSAVSFAVRWHGERPAVLWEQTGEPIELTAPAVAPGWSSRDRTGETLWPAPPSAAGSVGSEGAVGAPPIPGSFS